MMKWSFIIVLYFCSYNIAQPASIPNTITTEDLLTNNKTIVSKNGNFELGFFQPGNSWRWYLGIWYHNISPTTVVWVANRESPLNGSLAVLRLTNQGVLILENGSGSQIWSSTRNSSGSRISPLAQLLDSGNLVVRDDAKGSNLDSFLWQSFDYPTDNLLPGMLLGRNVSSGFDRYLTSWRSADDPSPGIYAFRIDPHGFPQLLVTEGTGIKFRHGPWNGIRFVAAPNLKPNPYYKCGFVLNETAMYYNCELLISTVITRLYLDSGGLTHRFIWTDLTHSWLSFVTARIDSCDAFAYCGAHASCNVNKSPACRCLKGFEPKVPEEWAMVTFSSGCVRKKQLECGTDKFLQYSNIKLPDTRFSWYNKTLNLHECGINCKKNCSCMAFTTLNISDGSGCLLWFGDLLDIKEYNEIGQDIYIRMSASEPGVPEGLIKSKLKEKFILGSVLPIVVLSLCVGLSICILKKHRKGKEVKSGKEDIELPLFDLATVAAATNNFSVENKLGEGGFGPVYKGRLRDGQEVAVKRLRQNSTQGLDEFKNEVLYVAKLQHRNLVKLLGCCSGEENLLIYEYMPNKGLDYFIFDQTRRKLLHWDRRFHIINGIARGLLYLHQDSRLRIIHRDLKASNVLLDNEMNPKISDFGMARSFKENQREANTKRVVGTYGYMSPEYAIDGIFSIKSDVFSYGVLVLEIVSGTRNREFSHPDHNHNLPGHAWWLYTQERSIGLLDHLNGDSYNKAEVLRSIHVGLLCVQRNPVDRPSMSSVVVMLGSENLLPPPKEPGFFNERNLVQYDTPSSQLEPFSGNDLSVSLTTGR